MEKTTVKNLLENLIERDGKLVLINLERQMIENCSDAKSSEVYALLNTFFRIDNVRISHDLEIFHFPEDLFEACFSKVIEYVPQKTKKAENQVYETASSYMKMKARKKYINIILKGLGFIDNEVEISFKDYKFSVDWYEFTEFYDSKAYVEYDKFREQDGGLYDLNTKECYTLNPQGMILDEDLRKLREYILFFLYKRIIMTVPGVAGAINLLKEIYTKEKYTKDEVDSVIRFNKNFANFVNKYIIDISEEEYNKLNMFDKELRDYYKNNNDYTLYVKCRNHKKNRNSEYLRRCTVQSYIEDYHNAIGAIYGYELFEDSKSIEKDNFTKSKPGRGEPIKAIFSRLKEDKMVTYKENLDWNEDEVDEFYISYSQEAQIQEIDDCISSIDEIANLETL